MVITVLSGLDIYDQIPKDKNSNSRDARISTEPVNVNNGAFDLKLSTWHGIVLNIYPN